MEFPEKILKVMFIIIFMIFGLYLIQTITNGYERLQSQKPAKPNPAKELLVRDVNKIYNFLFQTGSNRRKDDRQHQNDEISNPAFYSSTEIHNNPGNEQGDYVEISLPLILPVDGDISISSDFGTRRDPFTGRNTFHNGIDIPLPTGTPICSSGNGFVARTGYSSLLGKFITINHGKSYQTIYGHLSSIRVQSGQKIQMGEIIGQSGNTGRSTNPHLHYQVNYKGQPSDPIILKRELTSK